MLSGELEKLLEEIQTIDKQALEMAELVLENPVLRHSLAPQGAALRARLLVIADALKSTDPNLYRQWTEKISESILDLNFVERDLDSVSLRLGRRIGGRELRRQKSNNQPRTFFPLPEGIRNFTQTLKSDLISFQTDLSLEEIAKFYRKAFGQQGLTEHGLVTSMSEEHLSLAFLGLPDERMALVQAIDLGHKTEQDLRYISLRTEKGPPTISDDSPSFEEGKRIRLVEERKETFTYIYAEVVGTGDLLLAGTRAGEAPRQYLDRDSFGYWVTVSCDQKENVLKALIENIDGKEAFKNPELLAIKGNDQDVEARDRLLLHYLNKAYKGNPRAVQDFVELLKAKGIDHQFHLEV
jgi:hypothetical protein